jgi:hypothetical protein
MAMVRSGIRARKDETNECEFRRMQMWMRRDDTVSDTVHDPQDVVALFLSRVVRRKCVSSRRMREVEIEDEMQN